MSYVRQKCKKTKWGSPTWFQSEIKRVENYLDFEKLVHVHVIQHGLQGFVDED